MRSRRGPATSTLTPGRLSRPPRRVRGSVGVAGMLWFMRIFTLPHVLAGIGVIIYVLFLVLWEVAGTDVPGVVTSAELRKAHGNRTAHCLNYQYVVRDHTRWNSDCVDLDVYQRLQPRDGAGPRVTVRHLSIGPIERAALRDAGTRRGGFGFLVFWAVMWNSMVGMVVHACWIKPLRVRWLYRHGEATSGRLTGKRVRRGRGGPSYFVSYAFTHPNTGKPVEVETQTWSRSGWNRATEDERVIVLYAPDNPRRSTVYEYGGYWVEVGDEERECPKSRS
jgi:hypothetical protein